MNYKPVLNRTQLAQLSKDMRISARDIVHIEEAVLSTLFTNVLNEQKGNTDITYVKAKYEIIDSNAELISLDAPNMVHTEYMSYIEHCLKKYFEHKGTITDGIYEIHVIFSSLSEDDEIKHIVTSPPIIKRKDLNDHS